MKLARLALLLTVVIVLVIPATAAAGSPKQPKQVVSADSAIVGIHALGFVDTDGAKLAAVAVEYNVDMKGADVSAATYAVEVWKTTWNDLCFNFGKGNVGDVTRVYVNSKPEMRSKCHCPKSGKYVIIEVYTDYQWGAEQYFRQSMIAGVTQTADIKTRKHTVTASATKFQNYTMVKYTQGPPPGTTVERPTATVGKFSIEGIEGFKYYTNNPGEYGADGPAFTATDCFSELDGTFQTKNLAYALYVPKNYRPWKKYALVTLQNPAAGATTHPVESVLATRGPSVYISDWAQNIVKKAHGLAGAIVVVPTITERVTDDACTPAEYVALMKLWDHLLAEYSIDRNHIYGTGQSVGGMVLMETNRNRDNYFAGIWLFENQWAQNYYKDQVFARGMGSPTWNETKTTTPRHYPRTDGYVTWNYHWGRCGQKVFKNHDPNNYYYQISDDNILLTNNDQNYLSNNTWTELNYLYSDLVGYSIPKVLVDAKADLKVQAQTVRDYFRAGNRYHCAKMGHNWITFKAGVNGYSCRRLDEGYKWLLTQTRKTEMARPKLDLNKPFKLAATQDMTRVMPNFVAPLTDPKLGVPLYYVTGKAGSGTQFYNTVWLTVGTNVNADSFPCWLPAGMTHPVKAAAIKGVKAIRSGGKLQAVAVKYSVDMEGAVIHMKGDKVIDSKGNPRDDDFVVLDTYEFYDRSGAKIAATITNVYMNDAPAVVHGAARGSGDGKWVIVEIDTASTASSVGVVQRATVRTDEAIGSASSRTWTQAPKQRRCPCKWRR